MNHKYKNTYIIDMNKVLANHGKYVVPNNFTLPIIKRNGQDTAPMEYITGCSVNCIATMVERFPRLEKRLGLIDASTVVQYLDKDGIPIVTLYPTGETDLLNPQWGNFDLDAQRDLLRTQSQILARISGKTK